MEIQTLITSSGASFVMLPPQRNAPAPTLFLFAMTGADTLTIEPYCRVGHLLHAQGWNVVSLDLPCHGADQRPGEPPELAGWAARTAAGEDLVAAFQTRVNDIVDHLIAQGIADPAQISAAGTSRGGYLAFQAAAGNPRIRAIAAFAPVTDLLALNEFAGQDQNPLVQRLALLNEVEKMSDRASWVIIGNADARVSTDKAVAFSRAVAVRSQARCLACDVTLQVLAVPGHNSLPEWHDEAAAWFLQTVVSTERILPLPGDPLAVPCTIYPPMLKPGQKPGLVIHLYGHGGSHTYYNMMRPAFARLRRQLREAGYWLIVPGLGSERWMTPRAVATLDAIIAEMTLKDGVDPPKIHLIGTSMGGGSSLIYASQRPKTLRSLCAVFPMTDLVAWTKEQPWSLDSIAQAHGLDVNSATKALADLSPINHVAALTKTPLFLLHGDADACVPVHHSRELAAAVRAAGGEVVSHEVPGGGHDDGIVANWQNEIMKFILYGN